MLIVVPWTRFWDRNYFIESLPFLDATLTNPVVRGGVSGFGVVSLGAAVVDVVAVLRRRWARLHNTSGLSILARPVELAPQDLREEV